MYCGFTYKTNFNVLPFNVESFVQGEKLKSKSVYSDLFKHGKYLIIT